MRWGDYEQLTLGQIDKRLAAIEATPLQSRTAAMADDEAMLREARRKITGSRR